MRPSVVLLGFLLGSSASICFGLLGVALVFWILGPENPELAVEIGPLLTHLSRFLILTAVAAISFIGLLQQRPWRRISIVVLLLVLAAVVLAYLV